MYIHVHVHVYSIYNVHCTCIYVKVFIYCTLFELLNGRNGEEKSIFRTCPEEEGGSGLLVKTSRRSMNTQRYTSSRVFLAPLLVGGERGKVKDKE